MHAARASIEEGPDRRRTTDAPLAGRRVMMVGDEALVAIDLEVIFGAAGAVVVGPFPRLFDAMRALKGAMIDVAVPDVVSATRTPFPWRMRSPSTG